MKFSDEKIQEIRETIDIVEFISQYVSLKKRGKTYVGLCPFHSEKTPSFSVEPIKGFYHCFGCGVGGNVFTFLMEMEKISFPEAVRFFAKRENIDLPESSRSEKQIKETESLYHINRFALQFYQACLKDVQTGQKAREYLNKRGFDLEIQSNFQIGYAPNLWDGLFKKALKNSVSQTVLNRAGLIIPRKDKQGFYDRFRERIIFPIFNPSGRVVGFGGRTLKDRDDVPKYINSPETLVYQKSQILYGLFQSKLEIQKSGYAIIVEGYTDLMRCYQYGIKNVVATSGTALTSGQAKILSRYVKQAILIYDGDSAGFDAAKRGVDILIEAELRVKIVMLPEGSDPDSFVRSNGDKAMLTLIHSAQSIVDFHIARIKDKEEWENAQTRADAAHTLLKSINRIHDPIEKRLMIKDLAEKLMLEEQFLYRHLNQQNRKRRDGQTTDSGKKRQILSAREIAENSLISILFERYNQVAPVLFKYLDPDHFKRRENRHIFEILHNGFLHGESLNVNNIMDQLQSQPTMVHYLTMLITEGLGKNSDWSKFGLDCLLSIKQSKIQEQIDQVRQEIKSKQHRGEDTSVTGHEWMSLKKKMKEMNFEINTVWKKNVEN